MITTAVERNGYVYVYGEGNRQLFSQKGELQGYTASSVSIRRGDYIYVFNEKGSRIGSHFSPKK